MAQSRSVPRNLNVTLPRARSLAARLPPDARNASTLLDRPFDRAAAERQCHRAMVSGSERLKRELRYNATYFKRMVDADAGLAAAKQLLGRGCDVMQRIATNGRNESHMTKAELRAPRGGVSKSSTEPMHHAW